jgi:hypothetical protein
MCGLYNRLLCISGFELMSKFSAICFLGTLIFWSSLASACSIANYDLFLQSKIETANYYWLISAGISFVVLLVNYKTIKAKALYVLPALIVIFHPAWTIDPMWGPDCVSHRVLFSKLAVGFLSALVLWLFYKIIKPYCDSQQNHANT